MNAHVSNIARTCYFELHRLASIHRFQTSTATATLVPAFVLSKINYCSSLLFGSTHDVTSHLQRIQNYAARVILGYSMSSSITIHLKSLHWLPVKVRSTYKIACLCYHCHSSTAPSYVTDMMLKTPSHTRITRSSSYTMPLLNGPAHSMATLGDRAFSLCFFFCLELHSKLCQVCPITVIIYVSFEDILVSFSLQGLNFIFDHCTYVLSLTLLLIC